MFKNETLQEHLESSNSIESGNAVIAEWNMNVPGNIAQLGNYRYRESTTNFSALPNTFDPLDSAGFYTGATDSNIAVEYGLEKDQSTPLLFTYLKDKEKLYYSLEECVKPLRPRSGINKLSYFNTNSLPSLNEDTYASTFVRPRYYMPTRDDEFKYWRSYRTESNLQVQVTSTVSDFGTLSSIVRVDAQTSTATLSNLRSVSELPVGKIFSASKTSSFVFGITATVQNIVLVNPTTWTANLINLTSTSGLRIGDQITAISGSGSLAGGQPSEVLITAITGPTSISYRVVGGTGPTVGTVTAPTTVPGDLTINVARVSQVVDQSTVKITIDGTINPKPGNIRNIYINKFNVNQEYGISKNNVNGVYSIDDCNPFVVYEKEVPANRLVIKVQTNVGDKDLGPFRDAGGRSIPDPFFGEENKTVPKRFTIQYLDFDNRWIDAVSFDENSTRSNGLPIFGPDGHLELEYGIVVPQPFANSFELVDTVRSAVVLPQVNFYGAAYLVASSDTVRGTLYVYNGSRYDQYDPQYTWSVRTDGEYGRGKIAKQIVNPIPFKNPGDGKDVYREFVWIKGIRLSVQTMNMPDIPLELIEISPRLVTNLSDMVTSLSVQKTLSDLASSALPVGGLMAGTGSVEFFDPEQTFNPNNVWNMQTKTGSLVAEHYDKRIKFIFYEVIKNVKNDSYYIPIKTLYTDGFPETSTDEYVVSMNLRDLYFHFESIKSPRLLLTEVSLSQAIALLLDATGFSNYVFKRATGTSDPVIPYFFVPPDQNVSEVLGQLALATQSAMFFDEYNNFVVMTKEYILDDNNSRSVDLELLGSTAGKKLANIISVASQERQVYNAGEISYTTRYIQKGAKSIAQARSVDREYVYSPSTIWEAAGTEVTTSANSKQQSAFTLSAVPLNTTLTSALPIVQNRLIVNNQLDVGESAYWLTRFQGFLYANGEIIKYDAVEYAISGGLSAGSINQPRGNTVWLSSNQEYQRYFSKLPFNGKIYPTGLVRIYAEPFYETVDGVTFLKNGPVIRHGRGQFGTPVVEHNAGLSSYWSDNQNVRGCSMDSSKLYTTTLSTERTETATINGPAGIAVPGSQGEVSTGPSNEIAKRSARNGIIRNFVSSKYATESELNSLKTTKAGTIQSSAFIMTGPDFGATATPQDFMTYVHKPINGAFKHIGTRLRIIGKVEAAANRSQSVVGGMTYFNISGNDPTKNVSIGGGSAGISIVNPDTNNGYFFELAALTSADASSFLKKNEAGEATVSLENILFYKVKKDANLSNPRAVPVRLWGGLGTIVVDDGNFAGQFRYQGEANPTVYDIAIEYVDVNPQRRDFYLYINQKMVQKVTDTDPIPLVSPSVGLFVRGTSKAMFENVYGLSKNYASNTVFDTNAPIAPVFGDGDSLVNASEALSKYALSGAIQDTYLTNINPLSVPSYNIFFEEFGTIMREAAYFNIKYDRAYPALFARIAPTFNRIRGYTVSGFTADSYGAEFLVFNNTDTALVLDDKSSNYLKIQGITFTQDTTNSVTVDSYLKKKGDLADPEFKKDGSVVSPLKSIEAYEQVRLSRIQYGKKEFTLQSNYIQDADTAENILGWIIEKSIKPRKLVGLNIFSNPTLQLGDIVTLNYSNNENIDLVGKSSSRYVVYNIAYSKSVDGPDMTIYLSEV
jgi:hypothetical protein